MTPEELLASKRDFSVVWLKFLQRFQNNPTQEVWIFEGKDDIDYYSPRIEMHYGTRPATNVIIAEGKKNSLQLRDTLSQDNTYEFCKAAFFVDLDFDDKSTLIGANTYLTPCYSIENFYFSVDVVDRFLTDRLQLFEVTDRTELARVIANVEAWHNSAVSVLLPYCALMALAKEQGDASKGLADFLRNQLFTKVVTLRRTAGGVEPVVMMDPMEIRDQLMSNWPVTLDDLQAQIDHWREIWGADLHKIIRGKFLIPCVGTMLSVLVEDSNKRKGNSLFSRRRPCSHQVRENEILGTLSRFADTPACLIRFLKDLSTRWQQTEGSLLLPGA
ncbi:DUF4435 domain-containing protein [Rhodoferax sp. TS-BS-61-7]|uniref:DUF4435 domain-containing protein n=1 Tax=Rhodoferax sp. TS-BS-61-7 TaxID=2094194 RepID=UPI000CF62FB5|nr:DUF4435 domain-containing protein [Rhodoferax sp. TS-BS-61-7]PQA76365.1 hypothetical protein C5F53_15680 [Rhodoferax sp. TS-BS-61-7]